MRVAVTGANGFVGRALCARLIADGISVTAIQRAKTKATPGADTVVASLEDHEALASALSGSSCVVHLAARVHVMNETADDALAEFRRVNVAGSIAVARAASAAGVRRVVYVSSIKVNGESTLPGAPFTPRSIPAPVDPYGISKYEAECALAALARTNGLELVVVRPVLVYGPGVRGNFRTMMKWVQRRVPLPLGAVHNRRSVVGLDNLTDLLALTVRSPAAAGGTFLVSDGEDISTPDLIRRLARAMHRAAILIPVPAPLLSALAAIIGKEEQARRLLESLQVDIAETRRVLAWEPPFNMNELLLRTVRGFEA